MNSHHHQASPKTFARRFCAIAALLLLAQGSCLAQASGTSPEAAASKPQAPVQTADLVGNYYLKSNREIGSELRLRADGSFSWLMSYGAIDQQAFGRWTHDDYKITLTSAKPSGTPKFRVFGEHELRLRKEPAEGSWVAIVGKPQLGPAANIEVMFEARSGKKASGVTDRAGDASVTMAANEVWVRVGLRPEGHEGKWQWLDVPAQRAKERIAAFAIDDERYVIPMAFESMKLEQIDPKTLLTDHFGFVTTYTKE